MSSFVIVAFAWNRFIVGIKPLQRRGGRAGIAVIVCGVLVLAALWSSPSQSAPALVTATVTRGDLEQTVEAVGKLKPKQLVSVGAQVSGRIETLHVELGDEVQAGDLIAEIDSRTQRSALKNAQAALRATQADRRVQQVLLQQYQAAFERQQTMRAGKATSDADYQAARANVKATQARIDALDATIVQRKTQVETAQTNLGYTRITAPIDGTVLAVVSKEGQTVNANQTAPTIVMLGNLDTMTVYTEISEADVLKTHVGQRVYFTLLGDPDTRYASTLRKIAPAPESIVLEDKTQTASSTASNAIYYFGLFDVPNPNGVLRTYMTAQVSIVLAKARDVLMVPTGALHEDKDGNHSVLVADDDGNTHRQQVTIGLDDGVHVAIKSGLQAGQRVVIGEAAAGGSSGRGAPRPR